MRNIVLANRWNKSFFVSILFILFQVTQLCFFIVLILVAVLVSVNENNWKQCDTLNKESVW